MLKYNWKTLLEDEEYGVEADTLTELKLGREEVQIFLNMRENEIENQPHADAVGNVQGDGQPAFVDHTELSNHCDIHNVIMRERNGRNGIFFSHNRGTFPNLEWCSGRGFPSERNSQ